MGGGSLHRFQIFKQNWKISRLVSSTIEFWLILGAPWEVGVGGWRWGWWEGAPMHVHTHTHACMTSYRIPRDSPNGRQPFAWSYHPYHACMCTCVGDTPNHPQPPSTQAPLPPRAVGSPKHQNSISLELIEIIRFCLKILYLWTLLNSYRL